MDISTIVSTRCYAFGTDVNQSFIHTDALHDATSFHDGIVEGPARIFIGLEVIWQNFELWAHFLSIFHPHAVLDSKLPSWVIAACYLGPSPVSVGYHNRLVNVFGELS